MYKSIVESQLIDLLLTKICDSHTTYHPLWPFDLFAATH